MIASNKETRLFVAVCLERFAAFGFTSTAKQTGDVAAVSVADTVLDAVLVVSATPLDCDSEDDKS